MLRDRFDPWFGKIPWRGKWQPAPVFLPGELHGQRNLAGYSPWGCKQPAMTEATYIAHIYSFASAFPNSQPTPSPHHLFYLLYPRGRRRSVLVSPPRAPPGGQPETASVGWDLHRSMQLQLRALSGYKQHFSSASPLSTSPQGSLLTSHTKNSTAELLNGWGRPAGPWEG